MVPRAWLTAVTSDQQRLKPVGDQLQMITNAATVERDKATQTGERQDEFHDAARIFLQTFLHLRMV
jgi:hypothetical protein